MSIGYGRLTDGAACACSPSRTMNPPPMEYHVPRLACAVARRRREAQGVGVKRQRLIAVERDVAAPDRIRRDAGRRAAVDACRAMSAMRRVQGRQIARHRIEAQQARLHGEVGAVSAPGLGERAEQIDGNPATRVTASWRSRSDRKASAARHGPSVCELDGPTPILNMSKTDRRSDMGHLASGPTRQRTRATMSVRSSNCSSVLCSRTAATMRVEQRRARRHPRDAAAARSAGPRRTPPPTPTSRRSRRR